MRATATAGRAVPPPAGARAGVRAEPAARRVRRGGALLIAAVLLALPGVPVLVWAFAERWPFPAVVPASWGLSGWDAAWAQGAGPAVLRSLALGLLVSAVATPLGALAGRALALHRVPWRRLVTLVLLAPIAVPPFAVVLGLGTLTLRAGVPGPVTLVAVLVTSAIPYTTYVMHAAYARYDHGFEEVARTLGAAPWDRLRRVQLPLVSPALLTAAFLAFLVAWGDYVLTLVLGAGRFVTIQQLLGATASGSGNASTVAVLALATGAPPVLLLGAVSLISRRRRNR